MRTGEGLSRFLTFIDAIVAIAVTLLVLPLVDIAGELDAKTTFREVLERDDNLGKIGAFLLSFVVIARLWLAHHTLFERVAGYDAFIRLVSLFWALTIVVLPFPTQLIATAPNADRLVKGLYIAVLLLNLLSMTALSWRVSSNRELRREGAPEHPIVYSLANAFWCGVALVVAVAAPRIGYLALLLLLLGGPTGRLLERRRG